MNNRCIEDDDTDCKWEACDAETVEKTAKAFTRYKRIKRKWG